jgi:FkbM family methyltransferase
MRGLQRFIPSGPYPRSEALCQDLYGNTWQVDPNEFIQRQIFYLGAYEREEVNLILRHLVRPAVILDVGANVGFYSLTLARAFPDCIVHGFEPDPEIFRTFAENCRLNGLANVRLRCLGLSERAGTAWLHRERGATGDNAGMGHLDPSGELTIETDTLDHYCQAEGIDRVDFLKVDVEGAELSVLSGAARLLGERRVGLLMVEISEWQLSHFRARPEDVWRRLGGLGYEGFRLRGGRLVRHAAGWAAEGNVMFLPEGARGV